MRHTRPIVQFLFALCSAACVYSPAPGSAPDDAGPLVEADAGLGEDLGRAESPLTVRSSRVGSSTLQRGSGNFLCRLRCQTDLVACRQDITPGSTPAETREMEQICQILHAYCLSRC